MLGYTLAIIDIICGLWLFLLQYFSLNTSISILLGVYLMAKFALWQDPISFVDGLCGIIIIFAAYNITAPLTYLFIIWLLQKGLFSFANMFFKH